MVPLVWAAAPIAVLFIAVLWLGYRTARLEGRLEALEPRRAPAIEDEGESTRTRPPPRAPAKAEPKPLPFAPLDTAAVLQRWELILPRLRYLCAEHDGPDAPAELRMRMWISQGGGVLQVRGDDTPLAACLAEATASHEFPQSTVPTQGEITLPWKGAATGGGR